MQFTAVSIPKLLCKVYSSVGSLQLIHVFVNIPFIKWLSKKKDFSLLTLEHSETDKYKCWINFESKVQILVNIYGTIKTSNFQLLCFLVLDYNLTCSVCSKIERCYERTHSLTCILKIFLFCIFPPIYSILFTNLL